MADYGFEMKHITGDTLVDGNYVNHALRQGGALTPISTYIYTENSNNKYAQIAKLNLAEPVSTPPIIAVQSFLNHVALVDMSVTNGTITSCSFRNGSTNPFNYKLFNPPLISNSLWGIEVFNSSGVKVFDGETKYFRIVDVVSVLTPSPIYSGDRYDFSAVSVFNHAPAGNPYYVVNSLRGYMFEFAGVSGHTLSPVQRATLGVKSISGTQASLGWVTDQVVYGGWKEADTYQTVFVVEG